MINQSKIGNNFLLSKDANYDHNTTLDNNHSSNNSFSYILLDLRISQENADNELSSHQYSNHGFLPMTVILDQSELKDENVT